MRNTIRLAFLALFLCAPSWAQYAQAVNQSSAPPPDNWVRQMFYSGSNLAYLCEAQAYQPTTTFYVSSSTLTSIVVSSNTGTVNFASTFYGWVGMRITVAGSATTALNATYKVTAVSGSTATITTSGVSNGTYNDSTLTVSTNAPLLNSSVWAIQALEYDSSNNLIGTYWAGTPGVTVSSGLACSSRANY